MPRSDIAARSRFCWISRVNRAALLILLLLPSCGLTAGRHSINEQKEDVHIRPLSRVSWTTVRQIADARGGKEDGEIWHIDRHKGDIRITKSRGKARWLGPRNDVELWHKGEDGSWEKRP